MLVKTDDYELIAIHDLVDLFSEEMKDRLAFLYERGAKGWDNPDEDYDYYGRIYYHLSKGNEGTHLIDAANLIMFLYNKERV